jgi:hypothetical protein
MPRKAKKPVLAGHKVGTKRSDLRWIDHEGTEWASKFEAEVYHSAKLANAPVRKCIKGKPDAPNSDTYSFWDSSNRRSKCRACGSSEVGQLRSYTPDLVWDPALLSKGSADEDHKGSSPQRYLVDVKGYLRAGKRSILRAFKKARPDADLRFIFQRDYRISKTATITSWCTKSLKAPYVVWDGRYPSAASWIMPQEKAHKRAIRR